MKTEKIKKDHLISREDIFKKLYHESFEEEMMKYILWRVFECHLELLNENKQETDEQILDANESAKLVLACKELLEYYGQYDINFITEDKSKNKTKSRKRNGSRAICNKKRR